MRSAIMSNLKSPLLFSYTNHLTPETSQYFCQHRHSLVSLYDYRSNVALPYIWELGRFNPAQWQTMSTTLESVHPRVLL